MYKIDIIMGVYNCSNYLSNCINSLLNQTFNDWRLIICDDGSIDDTYKVALQYEKKYKDRILLLKNEKNMGLNFTLNKCLKMVTAPYVARMDADDFSSVDRLQKELNFLESNLQYAFVSSNATLFDDTGVWGSLLYVEKPSKLDFLKISPFCHAAMMIRTSAIKSVNGYTVDKKLIRVEDYHLWFKLYAAGYKGYNIQEFLYSIRDDRDSASRRNWQNRKNEYYVRKIGFKMLRIPWYFGCYKYRPLLLGLLPSRVYLFLHKKRLK